MKIAYQQLNLDDAQVRDVLFDDLIQTVGDDNTARKYLEDLQQWAEDVHDEVKFCEEHH